MTATQTNIMVRFPARWKVAGVVVLFLATTSLRGLSAADAPSLGPRVVMIIRHAEKPDEKTNPDLSPKGFQRADALAKVIPAYFSRPDFLIATKRSKNSNRPVETLAPLGKNIHEEVEAKYADKDYEELARELLTDPKYAGKTVLIAWHHGELPNLAKALGAKDVPDKWDDEVFDRVWKITFDKSVATWKDLPEDALPGDTGAAKD